MRQIRVVVKLGSSRGNQVIAQPDDSLLVYLHAKAIDGQANCALIKVLASYFHVAQNRISIKNGHTSRYKTILLNDD